MATMHYKHKPSETRAKTPFSNRRTTFSGRSMGDDKLELNFHQFQLCVGLCVDQLDHVYHVFALCVELCVDQLDHMYHVFPLCVELLCLPTRPPLYMCSPCVDMSEALADTQKEQFQYKEKLAPKKF